MTNAEAIEEIKSRISTTEYVGGSYVDCVDLDALKLAIKALEAQEWVPCSDRMPGIDKKVLATTVWNDVTTAWRIGVDKWFIHEGGTNATTEDLSAWKPLPEPYQEDGNETD